MTPQAKPSRAERWVIGLTSAAGIALLVIGIRFIAVPDQAARFFGLSKPPRPDDLHVIVGLRDLWLALLLIGLAACRQWLALAIGLGLGALVCFADAFVVVRSSGRGGAVGADRSNSRTT